MKDRKVKLFLVTLGVLSLALLLGKATGSEFYMGATALYTTFIAGNVGEHMANKNEK